MRIQLNQPLARTPSFEWRRSFTRTGGMFAAVAIVAIHLAYGHDDFSMRARLCLGLLGAGALLAATYIRPGTVPALGLALAMIYAAIGLPSFSPARTMTVAGPMVLTQRAVEATAEAALLYALSIGLTTLLVDPLARPLGTRLARISKRADEPQSSPSRLTIAMLSIFTSLLLTRFSFGPLAQPAGLFASPTVFLTLLMWNITQTPGLAPRALLAFVLLVTCGTGLLSGMLANALMPLFVLGLIVWKVRGRLPLAPTLAAVLLLVALTPVKYAYRQAVWYSTEDLDTGDKVGAWLTAFSQHYLEEDADSSLETASAATAVRLSTFGQVAQIFDWVPSRIPHDGPERWLMAPLLLLPRVVWPNKPIHEELFNKHYTHLFRIQDPRRSSGTSITLPAIGDGYWRLGYGGVAVEGIVVGALVGFVQGVGRARGLGPLLIAASAGQIRADIHAFGILNGTLQMFLVALFVLWLVQALAPFLAKRSAPSLSKAS